MQQLQLLGLFTLILLVLNPSQCSPISGQCAMDQDASSFCIPSLEEYYAQVTNQPNLLNERSLAPWTYERNVDLSRVPQVIFEAKCLTSHSCIGVDSAFSVESIPIAVRMPVLRRNPDCSFNSVDFESVNIACICATTRKN